MADTELQPDETPLEWIERISPDEWEATDDGYTLTLRSGNRRVVVDPLKERASFDVRVETEEFGVRWQRSEVVDGRWYLQTTAGLLLWGIDDELAAEAIRETEQRDGTECEERSGVRQ